jgi:hypothetical protein
MSQVKAVEALVVRRQLPNGSRVWVMPAVRSASHSSFEIQEALQKGLDVRHADVRHAGVFKSRAKR